MYIFLSFDSITFIIKNFIQIIFKKNYFLYKIAKIIYLEVIELTIF